MTSVRGSLFARNRIEHPATSLNQLVEGKRLLSPDWYAHYRMTLGAHRKREQGDREDSEAYLQVLLEIYQKGRLIKSGAEMKKTINSLFVASRGTTN